MKKYSMYTAVILAGLAFSAPVSAEDYVITLKDNQFSPQDLAIPAGQKVKVTIKNQTSSSAEFESHELNREKVISAGGEATVFIGPLSAGNYAYMNEFHPDAKGTITAK